MRPLPGYRRNHSPRRRRQGGFTLFETVLVIAILALVSAGIAAMQPSVFKTQNVGRDEFVGIELMRACAERLLAVRLYSGYSSVKSDLCSVIAGEGGFGSPTVTLTDAGGNTITSPLPCSTATCTATINVAKTAAPADKLTPLTLRLSAY